MQDLYTVKAFKVVNGVEKLAEWVTGFDQRQANFYSKELAENKEYDIVTVKKLPEYDIVTVKKLPKMY